jgi:prepilin-type N-terminal cleavage/methylation domain-containing protein
LNNKGLTLIEVIVALSLFLAATVAFSYLLKLGAGTVRTSEHLTEASYSLQAKMEEIKACPFEDLTALNGAAFNGGKGKISITPVLADLVKIELELKWDPQKLPLRICTLRSVY